MLRNNSLLINQMFHLKAVKEKTRKSTLNLLWNSELHLPLCRQVLVTTHSRNFHGTMPRSKREDRREMLASMPIPDEGTVGERTVDVDSLVQSARNKYPDKNTFATLYNGIPFSNVPICNISVSKNNTKMSISQANGDVKLIRSCGMEGFKNTRKGTNVAAQATAVTLGTKANEMGFKNVRVKVGGLGPGRMSAIKGLQMSGLNIISVTDCTPVSWNPPRPRKQRKL